MDKPSKIIVHNLKAKELRPGDLVVAVQYVENPYRRGDAVYNVPIFTVKRDLDIEVAALLDGAEVQ